MQAIATNQEFKPDFDISNWGLKNLTRIAADLLRITADIRGNPRY